MKIVETKNAAAINLRTIWPSSINNLTRLRSLQFTSGIHLLYVHCPFNHKCDVTFVSNLGTATEIAQRPPKKIVRGCNKLRWTSEENWLLLYPLSIQSLLNSSRQTPARPRPTLRECRIKKEGDVRNTAIRTRHRYNLCFLEPCRVRRLCRQWRRKELYI